LTARRSLNGALGLALIAITWTPAPTLAISADVAKKCRAEAIKSHPPKVAGTGAYAQAEREAFRACVAKEEKPR
jgi:hypothetical protein